MATYLDLVNKVINESGMEQNELTYDSWNAPEAGRRIYPRVKRAVREAWRTLQMERNEWEFGVEDTTYTVLPRFLVSSVEFSAPSTGPRTDVVYRGERSGLTLRVINVLDGPRSGEYYVEFSADTGHSRSIIGEEFREVSPVAGGSSFIYKGRGAYNLSNIDSLMREPHWNSFVGYTSKYLPQQLPSAPLRSYLIAGGVSSSPAQLYDTFSLDETGREVSDFYIKDNGESITSSNISGAGVYAVDSTPYNTLLLFGHFLKVGGMGLEWVANVLEVDQEGNIVGRNSIPTTNTSVYSYGGFYYNNHLYVYEDDSSSFYLVKYTTSFAEVDRVSLNSSLYGDTLTSRQLTSNGVLSVGDQLVDINTMGVVYYSMPSTPTVAVGDQFAVFDELDATVYVYSSQGEFLSSTTLPAIDRVGEDNYSYFYQAPYLYFVGMGSNTGDDSVFRINTATWELDTAYNNYIPVRYGTSLAVDSAHRAYTTDPSGSAIRILPEGVVDPTFRGPTLEIGASNFSMLEHGDPVAGRSARSEATAGPSAIRYVPWDNWVYTDISYNSSTHQAPAFVSQDPKGNLVFYPQTLSPFDINFYYDTAPQELTEPEEVPSLNLLPPEYHDWIAWRALESIARYDKNPDLLGYAQTQSRLYKRKAERNLMPIPSWASNRYSW